ncbi:hypothetical protein HYN49_10550 [Flavobacterium pallidum]|uniref:Uncharacterized protein n=1 Tax=Flavobacterium pallidum TaxID=2172098 RepID=A0A2S1SIY3_9FLAO|nr:hypothetical protein HYN49_10550 [Flavobacterium pallidum]
MRWERDCWAGKFFPGYQIREADLGLREGLKRKSFLSEAQRMYKKIVAESPTAVTVNHDCDCKL